MRPVEVDRALERLSVAASTARAQLGDIRNQLGRARSILDEIRHLLGGDRRTVTDSTLGASYAQGEKG
jgi:hypothetical protein